MRAVTLGQLYHRQKAAGLECRDVIFNWAITNHYHNDYVYRSIMCPNYYPDPSLKINTKQHNQSQSQLRIQAMNLNWIELRRKSLGNREKMSRYA